MQDEVEKVIGYHTATKHHLDRYALGPGGLDWATQPDPFRRYDGARLVRLELIPPGEEMPYGPAFFEGRIPPRPNDKKSLSQLFHDSLAISAWKKAGDVSWALRMNPSSGNLHPTEGYLITGPVPGLFDRPAVAHYAPKIHSLEVRAEFSLEVWKKLSAGLPAGSILIGLTSIHWREAWKYGERAFRYCQHDAGHAIATVSLAAAGLGWKATVLDTLSTDSLAALFGVIDPQGAEPEYPECLIAVYPQGGKGGEMTVPEEAVEDFKRLDWKGKPNKLSPRHHDWHLVGVAADSTRKPATGRIDDATAQVSPLPEPEPPPVSFRKMIHQRRSCLALNGEIGITREALYDILIRTLPGPGRFPFNAITWPPMIHLALFVHRVQDLDPGLYFLVRDMSQKEALKSAMMSECAWEKPEGCPEGFEFYRLLPGAAQEVSEQISCHQSIASNGCFTLGMIAEFERPLKTHGAWFYSRLFWESGMIGQVLYLEAEALGLRGTGIGCYFDDEMHTLLGLKDLTYQDLYHFTMGGHVDDPRLTTLPPYPADMGDAETSGPGRFDLP